MAKMSVIVARTGFEELAKTHVHKTTVLSVAPDEETALTTGFARIQEEIEHPYAVYVENASAYEIRDYSGDTSEVVGWEIQAYLTDTVVLGFYDMEDECPAL